MKRQIKIYKIISIYKKTYSYYGNPTLWLFIEDISTGETYDAKTSLNASCGYYLQGLEGTRQYLVYHITRNGNILIDYARGLEQ